MEDKYLWLEDILDKKSLNWVTQQNKKMTDLFSKTQSFKKMESEIEEILESKEKIPYVLFLYKDHVYNIWTDEKRVQGLIRRASILEYKKPKPNWEILLDLDVLSEEDQQKWVYHGMEISPNGKRILISLSPGGSDADIIREFDIESKTFVENGFELPLSKGSAAWFNDNEILVIRDFGLETITSSGYPRIIRKWVRGDELPNPKVLYETSADDVAIYVEMAHSHNKTIAVIQRRIDFYSGQLFTFDGSVVKAINLPLKFEVMSTSTDTMIISVREDWENYKSGDVLVYDFANETFDLMLRPAANASVYMGTHTLGGALVVLDIDVKSNLFFFSKQDGVWSSEKLSLPANGSISTLIADTECDDFFVSYDSFNSPASYFYGRKNKIEEVVKKQPAFFDYDNIEVSQHFVKSLDGTNIPYFVAHKKGLEFDGSNPTILYGYGGFEVTLKPRFNNILGKVWLDKGGVYVLANIRGGGEYGPVWHQAALKENRDRAYQDFFAIAEDLFDKKITSPAHLGAQGGSNGGLLMGVCFTQRPDLFRAVNCGVPLLDMHRYHKLLAGHSWMAEYGDPDDEVDGNYIRALSPYHRINKEQKNYPVIYLNTSTKDDRVHPGHARKFAAKLDEYEIPFHYYENINGGHAGFSNLKELAFIEALDYAFFWKYLK
jgi:prolyl oligopeptidase